MRQWFLAGNVSRAILTARKHGAFADAIARLEAGSYESAADLRLCWGDWLARAGDYAAAVDVVWSVPRGRATALEWIDRAIEQGGVAGARMLARKLSADEGSFPEVRARVLELCDDALGEPAERDGFARALVKEGRAPAAGVLARVVARALLRDGGRRGGASTKALVERLVAFTEDDALRADLPSWPAVARAQLALAVPRVEVNFDAADTGATPILDVAPLARGRTALALGEAGVLVVDRDGKPLFRFARPAHALVVSDRADRAIALAPRGEGVWRLSRLDLVGRRSEDWCDGGIDAFARDFDGSEWVVARGERLLVLDAAESRLEALHVIDTRGCRAVALARAPQFAAALFRNLQDGEVLLERYGLPSWSLARGRHVVASEHELVAAAVTSGAAAALARANGLDLAPEGRAAGDLRTLDRADDAVPARGRRLRRLGGVGRPHTRRGGGGRAPRCGDSHGAGVDRAARGAIGAGSARRRGASGGRPGAGGRDGSRVRRAAAHDSSVILARVDPLAADPGDLTREGSPSDTPRMLGRFWIIFASLGAARLLLGCSSPEPQPATTTGAAGLALVVLGSSTAAGFGLADSSASWVARYAASLTHVDAASRVVNLAVPGYTSYQVLATDTENPPHAPAVDPAHNITTALAESPDAILVNLPSNDASWKFPVEETMQNLGQLAAGGEAAGARVWVATSQPRDLDEEGMTLLTGLRDETLARFGDRALDFWTPLAAPDGKLLPDYDAGDGVHPNAAGHELLFEVVQTADLPAALGRD